MSKTREAIGGNYKFKDLKVYNTSESMLGNQKRYRTVFDESESKY